ncbi:DNA repair protein RecN [Stackebrandtia nassauensis]|uniref:DNA repair protein RecN n=1 Tax=Stackebrandtia nassauensis (strain DSM 44728 / CIP 108903 / NRRL B-16338 / NBRC 102104 / LLR-40K-21) TaxID=446470 RepID=D3Q533_STANL|nr:DNA repair protein RecN [Stackebrandtia nassauensis]ADD44082.1 DNA repair protein RecN [Stackebrandtia nassauensis DSM 44728]
MLDELRITGLGVIEDATLPLSKGLTVITGETGAGKTMVVAGLGLLFGGRADTGRVRPGEKKAMVEGRIRVKPGDGALRQRVADCGAELEGDELLISRTLTAEGRSRAHVGGRSAPVGVLGEIGTLVLSIHGQSDQMRLLQPAEQRGALDRYAGDSHEKLRVSYRETYDRWVALAAELAERRANARERAREADVLRLGLEEIERVAPQPGEDAELAEEARRLEHAEALRGAAAEAHVALAGHPDVVGESADAGSLVGSASRALSAQGDTDAKLGELASRLEAAVAVITDVSGELSSYLDELDADPNRLAEIFERRAALKSLTRKYAEDIDGVLAWAADAAEKLASLDVSDEALAAMEADRDRLAAEAAELAAALTKSRKAAATRFAEEVTAELAGLAMPHARVSASVEARPVGKGLSPLLVDGVECGAGPDGVDEVELRLRPHPGAPDTALQRGASGGELSRVMLAIEAVFAGAGGPPVLVFDEVDAGVGGEAAVEIGRRLAKLAKQHQVVVVTHLAQVAAFADSHLAVSKDTGGAVTVSGVREVEDAERARELARMLAGMPDSHLGIAHAEELLAVAARAKRG